MLHFSQTATNGAIICAKHLQSACRAPSYLDRDVAPTHATLGHGSGLPFAKMPLARDASISIVSYGYTLAPNSDGLRMSTNLGDLEHCVRLKRLDDHASKHDTAWHAKPLPLYDSHEMTPEDRNNHQAIVFPTWFSPCHSSGMQQTTTQPRSGRCSNSWYNEAHA